MTFEQFQATGKDCNNIGRHLFRSTMHEVKGRIYCDALWVEDVNTRPPEEFTPGCLNRWRTELGPGKEFWSNDLTKVELALYEAAQLWGFFKPKGSNMSNLRLYVAVLPDGREYVGESTNPPSTKILAQQALDHYKVHNNRNDYTTVSVRINSLEAVNGDIQRRKIATEEVLPRWKSMTDIEYDRELRTTLNSVPFEFREVVSEYVADIGSYEERVSCAASLAAKLHSAWVHTLTRFLDQHGKESHAQKLETLRAWR